MKTFISSILMLLCLVGVAKADEESVVINKNQWNTTDKLLVGSLVVLQVVDVAQTKRALKQGGYEMNPLFGKHPSDGELVLGKVIGTSVIYYLADSYPEYRIGILIGANVVQGLVVRHNYVGAKVGFGF